MQNFAACSYNTVRYYGSYEKDLGVVIADKNFAVLNVIRVSIQIKDELLPGDQFMMNLPFSFASNSQLLSSDRLIVWRGEYQNCIVYCSDAQSSGSYR